MSFIIQFFMRLQKEQRIVTLTKTQFKRGRKRCRSRKPIFCPTKYVQLSPPQTPIMRISDKETKNRERGLIK